MPKELLLLRWLKLMELGEPRSDKRLGPATAVDCFRLRKLVGLSGRSSSGLGLCGAFRPMGCSAMVGEEFDEFEDE